MACCGGFSKEWLRRRLHLKEKEQKSIWIRASIRKSEDEDYEDDNLEGYNSEESEDDDLEYAWYKLNPEDPKLTSGSPVPRLPLPSKFPGILDDSGFAVSSSRIYVVGGCWGDSRYQTSADVYILDFNVTGSSSSSSSDSSSGWIAGPPMLCPRYRPTCIVDDEKLYVFGGHCRENLPFGEFFDPTTSRWEALPQTPIPKTRYFSVTAATVFGGYDGKRYIPVHLDNTHKLMGFCIEDLSWFYVDYKFDPKCAYMVVVDDVIYSIVDAPYDDFPIAAYHLPTKRSLFVHNNIKTKSLHRLIHVGNNKFWLFRGGPMQCRFVEVKVRKNFRGPTLESVSITSVSSGHFSLDGFDVIVSG